MNYVIFVILTFILSTTGCVSKTEYQGVTNELQVEKAKVEEITLEKNTLKQKLKGAEVKITTFAQSIESLRTKNREVSEKFQQLTRKLQKTEEARLTDGKERTKLLDEMNLLTGELEKLREKTKDVSEKNELLRIILFSSLTFLAGEEHTPTRVAILSGNVRFPTLDSLPDSLPYDSVFSYPSILPGEDPIKRATHFRNALNALMHLGVKTMDIWVEGIDGLVVRQAIEENSDKSLPVKQVVLINTPNRGISSTGWPFVHNEGNTDESQLYSFARSGSDFLTHLNKNQRERVSSLHYVTVWINSLNARPRSSVMNIPGESFQLVVESQPKILRLDSLLQSQVLAFRHHMGLELSVSERSAEPNDPADLILQKAPRDGGGTQVLQHFLVGDLPAFFDDDLNHWVEFSNNEENLQESKVQVTPNMLQNITNPVSVGYSVENNEIVITGYEDFSREPLHEEVFWRAIDSYESGAYPAVSIDPPTSEGPTDEATVRYVGQTEMSRLGGTLFEADRVMKILGLGKDNINGEIITSNVSGHKTIAESQGLESSSSGTVWRLWLEPDRWHAREEDLFSATIDAQIGIFWEKMTENYAPSQSIIDFTQQLTNQFPFYALEQPSFDYLDQMAKLIGMAKWISETNIHLLVEPKDLDAPPVTTPTTTPLVEVRTGRQGSFVFGLQGGAIFCSGLRHVKDANSKSRILTTAALEQRPLGSQSWNFMWEGHNLQAIGFKPQLDLPMTENTVIRPEDQINDPPHTSESCIRKSFKLVGPIVTDVLIDDSVSPVEVILEGLEFSQQGEAFFNGETLEIVSWDNEKVVIQFPEQLREGTLFLRTNGKKSNAIHFKLTKVTQPSVPPTLTVTNKTDFPMKVLIVPQKRGSNRNLNLDPGENVQTKLLPGPYVVTAEASNEKIIGGFQEREETYQRDHEYFISYETREFPFGELVIHNNTGGSIALSFSGAIEKTLTLEESGMTTFRLAPGEYTIEADASCGRRTDTNHFSRSQKHQITYSCMYYQVPGGTFR